jgi:hypothetical protein
VLKNKQSSKSALSRQQALLATCFLLISCLAYPSVLKMEAIFPSEMSI